jgi:hypothetical protein
MSAITGGCLCGAVRYRSTGSGTLPTLCHCATCRKASGAHAVGWINFAKTEFQFTSKPPTQFRSSSRVIRSFCPTCGTPLTYWHEGSPEHIDVTIGSLDAPDAIAPADHTWMSDAVAWDRPADGLPQFRTSRAAAEGDLT